MKQTIRLTESQFKKVITETIKIVLKEHSNYEEGSIFQKMDMYFSTPYTPGGISYEDKFKELILDKGLENSYMQHLKQQYDSKHKFFAISEVNRLLSTNFKDVIDKPYISNIVNELINEIQNYKMPIHTDYNGVLVFKNHIIKQNYISGIDNPYTENAFSDGIGGLNSILREITATKVNLPDILKVFKSKINNENLNLFQKLSEHIIYNNNKRKTGLNLKLPEFKAGYLDNKKIFNEALAQSINIHGTENDTFLYFDKKIAINYLMSKTNEIIKKDIVNTLDDFNQNGIPANFKKYTKSELKEIFYDIEPEIINKAYDMVSEWNENFKSEYPLIVLEKTGIQRNYYTITKYIKTYDVKLNKDIIFKHYLKNSSLDMLKAVEECKQYKCKILFSADSEYIKSASKASNKFDTNFKNGKYAGKSFKEVLNTDINYLCWYYYSLKDNNLSKRYIKEILLEYVKNNTPIITFGKYNGTDVKTLVQKDYDYAIWLYQKYTQENKYGLIRFALEVVI